MEASSEDAAVANYSKLCVFGGGNKAGMKEMDKEKQARVIYEMSKGSKFFQRATKLDEATDAKVEAMKRSFAEVHGALARRLEASAHQRMLDCESRRSFERICCVLDMDMFFAAVEIRDQPHLKDLPVAVGGEAMISTSNYVARKFGVRAAMPGFIAKKLCPNLVFVHHNFDKYRTAADQLRSVIREYDPHFQSYSLDEVYFDLTDASRARLQLSEGCAQPSVEALRAEAVRMLAEIRRRITEATNGLTCSAGMANNFTLAKICADINKPDGQYELPPSREAVLQFVCGLPTRKVPGIGRVAEKILDQLGMPTMGEVRENMPRILHGFSASMSEFLLRTSLGVAAGEGLREIAVETDGAVNRKSIGCERTYSSKGISDPAEVLRRLHEICVSVSKDMADEQLRGKRVTVKVKDPAFHLHTRCQTLTNYISTAEQIEAAARDILKGFGNVCVRLLGVTVSRFEGEDDGPIDTKMQRSMQQFLSSSVKASCEVEDLTLDEDEDESISEGTIASNPPSLKEHLCFDCPLCGQDFSNLISLNCHLDSCLLPDRKRPKPSSPQASSSKRASRNGHAPISKFFTTRGCP